MPLIVETFPDHLSYNQTDFPEKYRKAFHVYPDFWPENSPGQDNCCESEISEHMSDNISGYIREKTGLLDELQGVSVVFHCFSPWIAAFIGELLNRNETVTVILPAMDPQLIHGVFTDNLPPENIPYPLPASPLSVQKFPSIHALYAHLNQQENIPVFRPANRLFVPNRKNLSLRLREAFPIPYSVLSALLDEENSAESWINILTDFPARHAEVQAAEHDSPLALLGMLAPYQNPNAPEDAKILLDGLEELLLLDDSAQDTENLPDFFSCLAESAPKGHLSLLSDECLTPPPVPDNPSAAEKAFTRCLALQGHFLLHLINRMQELTLSYAAHDGEKQQHLFAPLALNAEIHEISAEHSPCVTNHSKKLRTSVMLNNLPYDRFAAMTYFLCPYRFALEFSLQDQPIFTRREDCLHLAENILIDWSWRLLSGQETNSAFIESTVKEQANLLEQYLPLGRHFHSLCQSAFAYITEYLNEKSGIRTYAPSHSRMKLLFGQATYTADTVSGEIPHPAQAFARLVSGNNYQRQYPLHAIPKTPDEHLQNAMQMGDFSPQQGPWCSYCPHKEFCSVGGMHPDEN